MPMGFHCKLRPLSMILYSWPYTTGGWREGVAVFRIQKQFQPGNNYIHFSANYQCLSIAKLFLLHSRVGQLSFDLRWVSCLLKLYSLSAR